MVTRPEGMPPWWNTQITCRNCGTYIIAFTPKHPNAWERELEALKDKASERCYCRRPYDELLELIRKPENKMKEHTLYRAWLNHALMYRRREIGEGGGRSKFEWTSPIAGEWSDSVRPTDKSKTSARRSGKKR